MDESHCTVIDRQTELLKVVDWFSFHRLLNRGVLISGGWNRGVPMYTEVSSFQGIGIEGFHCIKRCPPFRVLE